MEITLGDKASTVIVIDLVQSIEPRTTTEDQVQLPDLKVSRRWISDWDFFMDLNCLMIFIGCSGSETCHTITECSAQYTVSQMLSKACVQSNGAVGLCCNDITSNRSRWILLITTCSTFELSLCSIDSAIPRLALDVTLKGVSNEIVPDVDTKRALDIGESFFSNVTRSYPTFTLPRNTGTFAHTRLQKPKKGTERLQRLALIAMETARSLRNGTTKCIGYYNRAILMLICFCFRRKGWRWYRCCSRSKHSRQCARGLLHHPDLQSQW